MKNILNSEHTFIAGKTGSGKTFLAYYYLSGFEYVRVLDIKGLFNPVGSGFADEKDVKIVSEFKDLANEAKKYKYIIYRPNLEELTPEYYDSFFQWCYYQGNCTVCLDEVMGVYESSGKLLKWHRAIMTRGRELNVNLFNLTQRPSTIPQLLISESTHIFTFNLNLKIDREKMTNITGQEDLLNQPGKYKFWYYNFELENPVLGQLKIIK